MDHQYRENGARNIYSNYNQMRAFVECSPNQSKNYTSSTFLSSNRQNFEDLGKVLPASVSEFYLSFNYPLRVLILFKVIAKASRTSGILNTF